MSLFREKSFTSIRPPTGRPPSGRLPLIFSREDFPSRSNSKMLIPVPNKPSRLLPRNSLERLLSKIQNFEKIFLTRDFKTLNRCEKLEGVKIGKSLGKGFEGEVFESSEFVIKVGTLYDKNNAQKEKVTVESLVSLLLAKEVKNGNSINFPAINDVFVCNDQSPYSVSIASKNNPKLVIYTLMERLIDPDEIKLTNEIFENLVFQLYASIYFIQENFKMVHQDLHAKNIMIRKIKKDADHKYLNYKINGKRFKISNMGFALIIIDFGFSTFEFKKMRYCRSDFNTMPKEYSMSKEFKPNYDIAFITKSLSESNFFKSKLTDKMGEIFKTINNLSPAFSSTKRPKPVKGSICPKELFKLIEKTYSTGEGYFSPGWEFSTSSWFSFSGI